METVKLSITHVIDQPGKYLVAVSGEGFIHSNGKTVSAKIRGEDTFFDDDLFTLGGPFNHISAGSFGLEKIVYSESLNEDWGKDEIYALVSVEGFNSKFKTNVVKGYF